MATENRWGLTPEPGDLPYIDPGLGMTTSDDTEPWAPPVVPPPLTNGAFVSILTGISLTRLRTSYLRHRARRHRKHL